MQKYEYPSLETLKKYQRDGKTVRQVADLHSIPYERMREKLKGLGIQMKSANSKRGASITIKVEHIDPLPSGKMDGRQESVEEFIARGGKVQVVPGFERIADGNAACTGVYDYSL